VDQLRQRLEDEQQEVAASSATLAEATEQAQVRLQLRVLPADEPIDTLLRTTQDDVGEHCVQVSVSTRYHPHLFTGSGGAAVAGQAGVGGGGGWQAGRRRPRRGGC
jgi:hypothetical protein